MVAHFGLPVVRAYMRHVQDNAEEAVRRVLQAQGVPDSNITPNSLRKMIPARGVYVVGCEAGGRPMFGMMNMFTGGAMERLTIFALGIMPYITASIILQLATVVVPYLEKPGRFTITRLLPLTQRRTISSIRLTGAMVALTWIQMSTSYRVQMGRILQEPGVLIQITYTLPLEPILLPLNFITSSHLEVKPRETQ
jgi:hypothetical protein